MMKWISPILGTATLFFALVMNYLANAGIISQLNVGDISNQYDTLITPAGYAFIIWGLIYIGLIALVGFQWYIASTDRHKEVNAQIGIWLMVSNLANGAWVYCWLNSYFIMSVVVMLILLLSLVMMVHRLNMENWNAPLPVLIFVWWPISVYVGWIVLATVANFAALFVYYGWYGDPFTPTFWALTVINLAGMIYLLLLAKRNMREAAAVGVWGLTAIVFKQWNDHNLIVWVAFCWVLILVALILYHAYLNRKTLPIPGRWVSP